MNDPLRFYIAASHDRRGEIRSCRRDLERRGHKLVAGWLDACDLESSMEMRIGDMLGEPPAEAITKSRAQADLKDILSANVIVVFTQEVGTAAADVEFGVALARRFFEPRMEKRRPFLYVVGTTQIAYHALYTDGRFRDWPEFLDHLDSVHVPEHRLPSFVRLTDPVERAADVIRRKELRRIVAEVGQDDGLADAG